MFGEAPLDLMPIWDWAWKVGGPLMVVLVALGLASWAVLRWTGQHIIIPARDRLFLHLDRVDNAIGKTADAVGEVHASIREIVWHLRGENPPPRDNGTGGWGPPTREPKTEEDSDTA